MLVFVVALVLVVTVVLVAVLVTVVSVTVVVVVTVLVMVVVTVVLVLVTVVVAVTVVVVPLSQTQSLTAPSKWNSRNHCFSLSMAVAVAVIKLICLRANRTMVQPFWLKNALTEATRQATDLARRSATSIVAPLPFVRCGKGLIKENACSMTNGTLTVLMEAKTCGDARLRGSGSLPKRRKAVQPLAVDPVVSMQCGSLQANK